jgi:hypothetical protein
VKVSRTTTVLAVAAMWVTIAIAAATPAAATSPLEPPPGPLIGSLDTVALDGVHVTGWALDLGPGNVQPTVHIEVDGVEVATGGITLPRPDVNAAYPSVPGYHGFSIAVDFTDGEHQVCARVSALGALDSPLLGCRSVKIGNDPFGSLDVATPGPGQIHIAGWAIDPNTPVPVTVALYVDTVGVPVVATTPRGDVGFVYTAYGPDHGFDAVLPASLGVHQVCAYAYNAPSTGGATALIGCRIVPVGGSPFGALDVADPAPGGIRVAGWAIDPDTWGPDTIAIYIDGVGATFYANTTRPDVGAAFPAYGPLHGYDLEMAAWVGVHQVCVYGIDVGDSHTVHTLLGCRTVNITSLDVD